MVRPSHVEIVEAARVLRDGGLVAFPTETVYGLGADASNDAAVRHLYLVKRRPAELPLIVHLGEPPDIDTWAVDVPASARLLADSFWPGPLTLVLRRKETVSDVVTGGRDTVGLRVPAHPVALALLAELGGGIAAPSANRFGRVSPTAAADVASDLGDDVEVILDGGPCAVGVESTIVDCSGDAPTVLRAGGVSDEQLAGVLGSAPRRRIDQDVAAPGRMPSHETSVARVVLCPADQVSGRACVLIAEGASVGVLALTRLAGLPDGVMVLARPHDAQDYARVLYTRLREADQAGIDVLLAVPPSAVGVGAAVCDRLLRAAAR